MVGSDQPPVTNEQQQHGITVTEDEEDVPAPTHVEGCIHVGPRESLKCFVHVQQPLPACASAGIFADLRRLAAPLLLGGDNGPVSPATMGVA